MNGLYQISDLGRVRNSNGRLLKPNYNNNGYGCVHLHKDNKSKKHRVHRLVAMVFIPNPEGFPEVNHKDFDKTNNKVSNLEWCNRKYNVRYGEFIVPPPEILEKLL